jgi:hypothetical protein
MDSKTLANAYDVRWPLVSSGVFPNRLPLIHLVDDDAKVAMEVVLKGPPDRFHTLRYKQTNCTHQPFAPWMEHVIKSQQQWRDIDIDAPIVDLDSSTSAHLSSLPTLTTITILARSLDFPGSHWLGPSSSRSRLESVYLDTTSFRTNDLPITASLIQTMWQRPHLDHVDLGHGVLRGLSKLDWMRATHGSWHVTRSCTFECILHKDDVPDQAMQKPQNWHDIMTEDRVFSIRCIRYAMDSDHFQVHFQIKPAAEVS